MGHVSQRIYFFYWMQLCSESHAVGILNDHLINEWDGKLISITLLLTASKAPFSPPSRTAVGQMTLHQPYKNVSLE
jgi:hypothetical protein